MIGRPKRRASASNSRTSPAKRVAQGAAISTAIFGLVLGGWHGRAVIDPDPTCTMEDATDCTNQAGRTLLISDPNVANSHSGAHYFICNQSLLTETHTDASISGSGFPVKIHIGFPPGETLSRDAFVFEPGCVGDTDADGPDNVEGNSDDCENTIDLVVEVEGNGFDTGVLQDAMKQKTTSAPTCGLQVTGYANCGPGPERVGGEPTAHQDGNQLQGGTGFTYVDFEMGDYDAGKATCQGAGGGVFYSGNVAGNIATNTHWIRAKIIMCNTSFEDGIEADGNTGSVTDSFFRAGNDDSDPDVCEGYSALGIGCTAFNNNNVTKNNVDCEIWNGSAWVNE